MNTSKMSAAQTAAAPLINKKLKKKNAKPAAQKVAPAPFPNMKAAGKY